MNQNSNTFATRLQSQLLLRGKPISPTRLAREFNTCWRGAPVSTNAVRKWLYGPTLPKMEKIQVLAEVLDTSVEWLRWGQLSEIDKKETDFSDPRLVESLFRDWLLLNQANKQLLSAMLAFLLKQQNL